MKLYLAPGSCSLSPHIALREAGIPFEPEVVLFPSKKTKSGDDYRAINAKGAVPALRLDNGEVLTEGSAIVQYIADQRPELELAPRAGTWERYRLQEWLNFIASDVHKAFGPLFNPRAEESWKQAARELLAVKFDFIAKQLEGKPYLMGDSFTVADGYLFTILQWTKSKKIDMTPWPAITAYMDRIGARPTVRAALEAEAALR
jgi:glutathione S-transferase